jgi:hypothetical protein
MTDLKLVQLPASAIADIPNGLRNVADLIESGSSDDVAGFACVKALVWVTLDANGQTATGALGYSIDKHKTAGIMQQAMIELLKEPRP